MRTRTELRLELKGEAVVVGATLLELIGHVLEPLGQPLELRVDRGGVDLDVAVRRVAIPALGQRALCFAHGFLGRAHRLAGHLLRRLARLALDLLGRLACLALHLPLLALGFAPRPVGVALCPDRVVAVAIVVAVRVVVVVVAVVVVATGSDETGHADEQPTTGQHCNQGSRAH
jgi:hypothetical protein